MQKEIIFTSHALLRISERGATKENVVEAIRIGMKEPAQRGLFQYRLNLEYKKEWAGQFYSVQQVVPVVAEEKNRMVVVTVYVFYF